ncbi:MAG: MotA/TolQ/ExbB proton channel family protein [Bdellovibrionales bacterium]|nr:MotA/TolQ/ExbB proton channel family protein [Bdellovibrionales bacterium]
MLWLVVVEWLARAILLLLVCLSVWSFTIIIDRRRFFKTLSLPNEDLKKNIRNKQFSFQGNHFYSDMLKEISTLKSSSQMDKAFDAIAVEKKKELEKGLPILGTLGSTTPFVGLLGTILGIIVSFGELSQGTGSTNSVMFSLAEALILTAVGLVVAIPAVVAYNFYGRKVRAVLAEASSLKDLYIAYKE